ncbi:MAG: biotin--[acetyl-CoA-carboxylase] ligase [Victivallales bacterium]|nr:biotin--[acetyl-CoA-carboxylase] ligase [Victivallales bacterium]
MIIRLDSIDSTNRYALRELEQPSGGGAGIHNNCMVLARSQTAGRGRLARNWLSPPDENIYASYVIIEPAFPAHASLWICALASLETLRDFAPEINFWVKWPNDIFCDSLRLPGKVMKIAGLLAETLTAPQGNRIKAVVAGIGINVNMPTKTCDSIDKPATSLLAETGKKYKLADFAESLYSDLLKFRALATENISKVHTLWRSENKLLGSRVSVKLDSGKIIDGICSNLPPTGEMILDTPHGPQRVFSGDLMEFKIPHTPNFA